MSLFEQEIDPKKNYLPIDGTVNYYGKLFSQEKANHHFDCLLNEIDWKADQAVIFGKMIYTKRKVAWYGDREFEYRYSNITKTASVWTEQLLELKSLVEIQTGEKYNSCLLNLYHNGTEGMAWHSDAEKDLKKNGAIASLSFGAERKFSFRHKVSKETVGIVLEHGSLLVMKDSTQSHWLHRLAPTSKIVRARVNLTFRTILT